MCLSPLVIKNPSARFVRGLSKPLLTVACGNCEECRKKQQDDWYVRAHYELERCRKTGGSGWFFHLTYNNDNLPIYKDPEFDFHAPVFNPEHYVSFRNKLRIYLKRSMIKYNEDHGTKYNTEFKDDMTIRYFYACEYGEKNGRSHYHTVLFVPCYVPYGVMFDCVKRAWIYGFVGVSKKHGCIVSSDKAISYCMKYATKDMFYSEKYGIEEYIAKLKNAKFYTRKYIMSGFEHVEGLPEELSKPKYQPNYDALDSESSEAECHTYVDRIIGYYEDLKDRLSIIRKIRPRHRQSMGFGIDGLDYYKAPDGSYSLGKCVDGRIDASKLGMPPMKSGDYFKFSMPLYYQRKIFYNVDEFGLYTLSDFGKECVKMRYELAVKQKIDKFTPYFGTRDDFMRYMADCAPLDRLERFWDNISLSRTDANPEDLAIFDMVYRGVAGVDKDDTSDFGYEDSKYDVYNVYCFANNWLPAKIVGMSSTDARKVLNAEAFDFMLRQKSVDVQPQPIQFDCLGETVSYARDNGAPRYGFNHLFCYKNYDNLLHYIQSCERLRGAAIAKAYKQKRFEDESFKKFMPYPYLLDIEVLPYQPSTTYRSLNNLLAL